MFKAIVFCECSQKITIELRKLGVEAYSNDIKPSTGGHPEWHIQGPGQEAVKTKDFLLGIGHPPCTHIAVSGNKHFPQKIKDGRHQAGIKLFLEFTKIPIPHWCLENPISVMSTHYRKPDQIIQPYFFGDTAQKTTCLWLNNLPPLWHQKEPDLFSQDVTHVGKGEFLEFSSGKRMPKWIGEIKPGEDRGVIRSVTFQGIAQAMAVQWTEYIKWKYGF